MLAWKIAPALACGNTVVLKPAETTPLTALLFAELCQQADLPPGVVNIVTGAGETGAAIVGHDDVDKVAFTGSTEVGKLIQRELAGTGKRLTLELGGKAANIVFDDAPVDQAVEGIVSGIFFNQGHVCCAGSRLLVQESVHDLVVDKLQQRLETLRLGDPLDKNTDIGAINSAEQLERITTLVDAGEAEGATLGVALRAAVGRVLVPTHGVHRHRPELAGRPGGDLRPGAERAVLPHPRRGRRQGQQHPLRAVGRRLDREGFTHPVDGRPAARRRGLGQHLQPLRPHEPVRWVQGIRVRSGGRPPRPRRLPRAGRGAPPDGDHELDVRKTYKLYVGGKFPRSESGRSYEVVDAKGDFLANAPALAQGRA
jgi:aldehyde dehydrogenase (NAD+)